MLISGRWMAQQKSVQKSLFTLSSVETRYLQVQSWTFKMSYSLHLNMTVRLKYHYGCHLISAVPLLPLVILLLLLLHPFRPNVVNSFSPVLPSVAVRTWLPQTPSSRPVQKTCVTVATAAAVSPAPVPPCQSTPASVLTQGGNPRSGRPTSSAVREHYLHYTSFLFWYWIVCLYCSVGSLDAG